MLSDLRYALRAFLRSPGFAMTAALTLATGIGANTAIFSVLYALLLKPLPFRDPSQLVYLHDTSTCNRSAPLSTRSTSSDATCASCRCTNICRGTIGK